MGTLKAIWHRLAGQPAFLINDALFDFRIVLGPLAKTIIVTVPNFFVKNTPPRDEIQLGSAGTVMCTLMLYLTIAHSYLGPIRLCQPVHRLGARLPQSG